MDASAKPLAAKTSRAAASRDDRVVAARAEETVTSHSLACDRTGLGSGDPPPQMRHDGTASVPCMHQYRLTAAAQLLGVSDDTVRRWADGGRLATAVDAEGKRVVDGADLAAFAVSLAGDPDGPSSTSARNAFPGIVTR